MKNLSRLTALLLALMMLFTSMPAFATESEAIPVDDFDAAAYASLLTAAEDDAAEASWGNIFDGMPCADDNVFCQNVLHMLECPNAQKRYEYLNSLYSEHGVDLEFTMLHYYFHHIEDQENMTDSVVCTCSFPMFEPEYVPGDVSMHDESCPWHFANLSLAEQYDVIRDMDADTQETYKETLSADALDTLNRVNVSEYETGNVAISVPDGAFAEDYLLDVEPVTLTEEQLGLLFDTEASGFLSAFDITFAKLGEETTELQPAEGNPVNLDFSGLNDGLHVVYHLYETENGYEVEIVNLEDVTGGLISADAQAFSVYVVSGVGSTSNTGAITSDTLTVGDTKTYYWQINSGTLRYCIWHVDDPDGIISYEVSTQNGGYVNNDDNYQAPWIKVTALRAGTVTLTVDYVYRNNYSTTNRLGSETFTITIGEQGGFHIENKVPETGCLVPAGLTATDGVEYTWTRSDGQIVRADALNEDGSVNISKDRGGVTNSRDPITYTVTATITAEDGTVTTLGTANYEVLYGQEILNPSFENPTITKALNQYFYNGYPGLYWKTTAPGSSTDQLTQDIELVIKGNSAGDQFGVSTPAHGNQYAELNAENFGALYQDILTTPGATLTWAFSHAARTTSGSVNKMYVVMAATKDAQDIQSESDIDGLIDAIPSNATIPSSGTGYKLTYNGEVYYIWYHDAGQNKTTWENISGTYTVPEDQYLTRLFFATDTNVKVNNNTLGNLIDATSATETMQYKIEYYVNDILQSADTQTGSPEVYTYVQANKLSDYLDKYILTGATVNGLSYPGDVAADDFEGFYIASYRAESGDATYPIIFRLYFKEEAITVTKEVTISNWNELSSTKQLALMTGYQATFGLYKSTDLVNPITTVTVPITYAEGQDLIAIGDFPLENVNLTNGSYVVKEISATELTGYALTTTYSGNTFEITTSDRTANATCVNAYEFKKGALTITKNVTDGAFPADGKTFTFTVTPTEEQDLSNWLEDNDYTASGEGFVVTVDVGASKTASVTLAGLPAGKYNVVETADSRYNTTYQVGSAAATTTSAVATVTQNGEANVIVTNTAKTGELTITKVVKDSTFTEGSRTFNFTVAGPVTKTGSITVNAANKADSTKNTVTITDLPVGTYTVTETNAAELGYAPTYDKTQVTIEAGGKETVNVVNTASAKIDINVTKVWEDYNNLTNTRPVEITVNLVASYADASDTTLVSAPSGSTAADPWTHTFENVEKFDPNGNLITYRVTENEITGELYNDPAITGDVDKGFQIVNTLKPGSLEVTKTVVDEVTTDGATPDSAQAFTFAVTLKHNGSDLTGVTYSVDGGEAQTFDGTITLTNGQKATFTNLPAGTVYTVTETNIPVGFEVDQPEKTGTIAANRVSTAAFTNTFKVGDLKITKTVTGADAPSADTFTFTVKSDNIPAGTYGGVEFKAQTDDASTTDVDESKFVVATVVINTNSGSGTKTITGLPKGATFTVTEAGDADYELTSSTGTTGTIVENAVKEATFTNTYQFASLTIEKKGILPIDHHEKDGTNEKESQSTIFNVKGNGVDMNVVINGNSSVTIKHLPVGSYTVTEDETWSWRYSADKAEQSVTVNPTGENKVTFNNSRDEIYWLSGDCYAENNFGAFGTATN